jgi:hypothetical protein
MGDSIVAISSTSPKTDQYQCLAAQWANYVYLSVERRELTLRTY